MTAMTMATTDTATAMTAMTMATTDTATAMTSTMTTIMIWMTAARIARSAAPGYGAANAGTAVIEAE